VTITRCFVVKEKVQGEQINETHTHTGVCFLISFLVRGDYQFFFFFFTCLEVTVPFFFGLGLRKLTHSPRCVLFLKTLEPIPFFALP
jgi:hypothetical protein